MSMISCSEGILFDLKKQVLAKHNKLYGALKEEIDIALTDRIKQLEKENKQGDEKIA
jgi:hypothetical protein